MKLHVLSDLHLGTGPMNAPPTTADVVVLAGDIARPQQAIAFARALDRPVVYVPGNHEFYGGSLDGTLRELRELAQGSSVHVLERDALVIDGVRFLGTTLWTDFLLPEDPADREFSLQVAQRFVHDFSKIKASDASPAPFTPADSAALFARAAQWLEERLADAFDGPTVVVTHHAPSPKSIHARFAESPLNPAFVSNLERLLDGDRVGLWIHGHTHDSFDYCVNGTRVLCNPRGYTTGGKQENASFDAGLVVSV